MKIEIPERNFTGSEASKQANRNEGNEISSCQGIKRQKKNDRKNGVTNFM